MLKDEVIDMLRDEIAIVEAWIPGTWSKRWACVYESLILRRRKAVLFESRDQVEKFAGAMEWYKPRIYFRDDAAKWVLDLGSSWTGPGWTLDEGSAGEG